MSEIRTNKMLARLGLMYGPPSKDPQEAIALIGEFARLMHGYSDNELEIAADRLIKTRKFKTWPTVGECIESLEDHRTEVYERTRPERRLDETYPEWSKEAIAWADKRITGVLGKQAAKSGWGLGLHRFYATAFAMRKPDAEPTDRQVAKMMEAAKFADRCVAGEIPLGVAEKQIRSWAKDILAKRKVVADIALHGVVR